jgi:hypothetical protein
VRWRCSIPLTLSDSFRRSTASADWFHAGANIATNKLLAPIRGTCTWSPSANGTECRELLLARIYVTVVAQHCQGSVDHSTSLATAPAELVPGQCSQSVHHTRPWNAGIRKLIDHHPELNASFVDVFVASRRDGKHHDNIHMDELWYSALASSLSSVIRIKC